jgi:hypothetical protein
MNQRFGILVIDKIDQLLQRQKKQGWMKEKKFTDQNGDRAMDSPNFSGASAADLGRQVLPLGWISASSH